LNLSMVRPAAAGFRPKAVKREWATAAGIPATHCVNRA
jgi:hypothetical protein